MHVSVIFLSCDWVNCSIKLYLEKRLFSHRITSYLFLLNADPFSVLYYNYEFAHFYRITHLKLLAVGQGYE